MEAILMDVKRAMRSLLGTMHAVSGASKRGARGDGAASGPKVSHLRRMDDSHLMRDVYGRSGRVDVYSGRDFVEFYRAMSYGRDPLR